MMIKKSVLIVIYQIINYMHQFNYLAQSSKIGHERTKSWSKDITDHKYINIELNI